MKKLSFISVICVVVVFILAFSVFANGSISRAVYTDSDIFFLDEPLEFNTLPVLIVGTDEAEAKAYIPVREFFESMGYTVDWNAANRSIHINAPDPGETQEPEPTTAPEEAINSDLVAEAGEAKLYMLWGGSERRQYAMLTYGGATKIFDWYLLSPRVQYPEMYVRDVDGDGDDEIVIITWPGSGTGIFYNELHIVEIITEGGSPVDLQATAFDTYLGYIDGIVEFEAEAAGEKELIHVRIGDNQVTAETIGAPASENIIQMNMRGGLWICDITMTESGFHIRMPLAVQAAHAVPELVAYFDADFTYTGEGFEFENPTISELVFE